MDIITVSGNPTVIRLRGRFDAHEAAGYRSLADRLSDEAGPSYDVDLHDVNFVDSSALAELVRSMKRARTAGGDVRLVSPSSSARVILELTGLDRAFVVVDP